MKKIFFAFSLIIAVVMTACTPETLNERLGIPEDAILLSSERFSGHGTKTSVSDLSVKWVDGDTVYLNGGEYSVTVDNSGNAYVDASDEIKNNEVYGYYGVFGTPTWNKDSKQLVVGVPSVYTSSYDGTRQKIALPMVAYKPGAANKIDFKHVTAAINVQIMDSLGEDLYVDKVVVSSENYQICCPTGITLDLEDNNLGNLLVSTTSGNRRVTVNLPGNTFPVTNGSSNKVIQVPIRPIGTGDHLTIEVYCHGAIKNYRYSYRPDAAVPALGRNELLTAKVKLKLAANGGHVEEVVAPTYRSVNMASATYPFTAQDGDTLYGTRSGFSYTTITIPDGATVTLRDFKSSAITIKAEGTSTVNLVGTNSVTSSMNRPAVFVSNGNTLTIKGTGTITATGGSNSAGIGCGTTANGYANCGNIEIEGGTINAKGGSGAAGIGTGSNTDNICGNITIKSTVTSVTATKGSGATESIGKGNTNSTCGTITIADGANVTQN